MKKFILSLLLSSILGSPLYAKTGEIDVKPGQLQDMILDLEPGVDELILSGSLNSQDFSYIREGAGRMASIKILDLSKINLSFDNGKYASISYLIGNETLSYANITYYLSAECRSDTTYVNNGLGGQNVNVNVYTNDLSAAFNNNSSLKNVILPDALTDYGPYLFYQSAVESVKFPEGTKRIPNSAFYNTKDLKDVELTSSITEVEADAFYKSGIASFNFDNIQRLGSSAFGFANNLEGDINLSKVSIIPRECFYGTKISSVIFSEQLTEVGNNAFYDCLNLKEVYLPEGLSYIGRYAFYNCESINIPSSIEYIGFNAVNDTWLKKQPSENGVWYFGKTAYRYDGDGNNNANLNIKEGTISISAGFACGATFKEVILPKSIKIIGEMEGLDGVFSDCSALEMIEFHDGIEIIGNYAFSYCNKLNIQNWPEGLQEIGDEAFIGCSSLSNPVFPDNMKFIGYQAFMDCSALTSISLPESLSHIGYGAFSGCSSLYELKFNCAHLSSESKEMFVGISLERIVIGPNVTYIPDYFFMGNSLRRVDFENIEASSPELIIGEVAFGWNTGAKIQSLPVRTVSIGESTFKDVAFTEPFSLNNLTYVGKDAFSGSVGLEAVTIREDASYIGDNAFSNINTLKKVVYLQENSMSEFGNGSSIFSGSSVEYLYIGEKVKELPFQAFQSTVNLNTVEFQPREGNTQLTIWEYCFAKSGIENLILPEANVTLGDYSFYNSNLMTIKINDQLSQIPSYAFAGTKLSSIDLPPNLNSIGRGAFSNCDVLEYIYLHSEETPSIQNDSFGNNTTIFVTNENMKDNLSYQAPNNMFQVYQFDTDDTSYSFEENYIKMDANDESELFLNIPECYSGLEINYISSDPGVVSVNQNGMIKALSNGLATINVVPRFMSEIVAKCTINVGDVTESNVEDIINTQDEINIYTEGNCIVICGLMDKTEVMIFDMNGNEIHTHNSPSCFRSPSLSSGVYLVKFGNKTFKILI